MLDPDLPLPISFLSTSPLSFYVSATLTLLQFYKHAMCSPLSLCQIYSLTSSLYTSRKEFLLLFQNLHEGREYIYQFMNPSLGPSTAPSGRQQPQRKDCTHGRWQQTFSLPGQNPTGGEAMDSLGKGFASQHLPLILSLIPGCLLSEQEKVTSYLQGTIFLGQQNT